MTREDALNFQRELWELHANELNQCSVEPDGADEWVVELVWKDGRRERLPSLVAEMREVVNVEELRAAVTEADATWSAIDVVNSDEYDKI